MDYNFRQGAQVGSQLGIWVFSWGSYGTWFQEEKCMLARWKRKPTEAWEGVTKSARGGVTKFLVSSRRRSTPRFDQFSFWKNIIFWGHSFCWSRKAELLEQWLACMGAGVV
jgi:hypothetical protein